MVTGAKAEHHSGRKLLTSWQQETDGVGEGEGVREVLTRYISHGCTHMIPSFKTGPTLSFYHFSVMSLNYDLINQWFNLIMKLEPS